MNEPVKKYQIKMKRKILYLNIRILISLQYCNGFKKNIFSLKICEWTLKFGIAKMKNAKRIFSNIMYLYSLFSENSYVDVSHASPSIVPLGFLSPSWWCWSWFSKNISDEMQKMKKFFIYYCYWNQLLNPHPKRLSLFSNSLQISVRYWNKQLTQLRKIFN